jgi:hypothetical protein
MAQEKIHSFYGAAHLWGDLPSVKIRHFELQEGLITPNLHRALYGHKHLRCLSARSLSMCTIPCASLQPRLWKKVQSAVGELVITDPSSANTIQGRRPLAVAFPTPPTLLQYLDHS